MLNDGRGFKKVYLATGYTERHVGSNANMVVYTMVEIAKVHGFYSHSYLKYLLGSLLGTDIGDAELENLALWSKKARIACNNK